MLLSTKRRKRVNPSFKWTEHLARRNKDMTKMQSAARTTAAIKPSDRVIAATVEMPRCVICEMPTPKVGIGGLPLCGVVCGRIANGTEAFSKELGACP